MIELITAACTLEAYKDHT